MPDADKEALLDEITVLTDSMLQACAQFEQEVNDPLPIKQAQVYFREKTHPILSKSYLHQPMPNMAARTAGRLYDLGTDL